MAISAETALDARVERLDVAAYTIPTETTHSDGTLEWDATTIVVVEAHAAGQSGLGYTYADASVAGLIDTRLAESVRGRPLSGVREAWLSMGASLRNVGRPGAGFLALSAVDVALWDLKARLVDLPLAALLDAAHDRLPVYGSGGFTSTAGAALREELAEWIDRGVSRVKMKIGREPEADPARLDAAREAIGDEAELYVDANGAFRRKEALAWAERLAADWDVSWFEEPVSSADVEGLRLLRDRAPGGLEIAAGEYAYVPADFLRLVEAGAVDCLQADVTRCGGVTGVLEVGGLATAHGLDVSAHCAPALSANVFCTLQRARHLEWFSDQERVERLLFDGVPELENGVVRPNESRPGHGLELKRADAEPYAA